jgi:hypothetical protein
MLLISGASDIVCPEHAVQMFRMQTITMRIRHITTAMAVILMTALSTKRVATLESAPHVKSGYAPVS